MKKRTVAWLCLFVMLAGMLTGCGTMVQKVMEDRQQESPASGSDKKAAFPKETAAPKDAEMEAPVTYYTVYARADTDWGVPYLWAWSDEAGDLYEAWPGQKMEMNADGWYFINVPTTYDNVVVSSPLADVQTEDEVTYSKDIWFTLSSAEYSVDYSKPTEPAATTAPPEGYIAELEGTWEQAYLNDGSSNIQTAAKVYPETVYNVREMTVTMNVEMNAGTNCKDWQIWGRSGGTFVKLEKIYLEAGNGYGSFVVKFDRPVSFDAIAITPTVPGGYSWSMAFVLTDIWTTT